jgi:hypothetical protein
VREYGVGVAYQRFLWRDGYAAVHALPLRKEYVGSDAERIRIEGGPDWDVLGGRLPRPTPRTAWARGSLSSLTLLDTFNPSSVLCTAREIITLWVSRMVMFNRYFRDGKLPFRHVYIHAMIQDGHGQKMSKSLGNIIRPSELLTRWMRRRFPEQWHRFGNGRSGSSWHDWLSLWLPSTGGPQGHPNSLRSNELLKRLSVEAADIASFAGNSCYISPQ